MAYYTNCDRSIYFNNNSPNMNEELEIVLDNFSSYATKNKNVFKSSDILKFYALVV